MTFVLCYRPGVKFGLQWVASCWLYQYLCCLGRVKSSSVDRYLIHGICRGGCLYDDQIPVVCNGAVYWIHAKHEKVPRAFINAQIYVNSKSLRETTGTTRRTQRPNRTGGQCKSEEPPYWKLKHRRARGNLTPPAGVICYWNCVVVLRDSMCRLLLESRSKVRWLWFVVYCLHRFLSPLLHLLRVQYRVIVQQRTWK